MGGELSGGGCTQAGNRSAVELLLSYGASRDPLGPQSQRTGNPGGWMW